MTHQTQEIAGEVRAILARRQISQRALAPVLKTSQAGVSRRLTGQQDFTAPELAALAEHLEVPIAVLYGEHSTPSSVPALAANG